MSADGTFDHKHSLRVLATDMDGTIIPLRDEQPFFDALDTIRARLDGDPATKLIFVTGRRYATVKHAMEDYPLPTPDWIISDVGTSLYEHIGSDWKLSTEYVETMAAIVHGWDHERIFAFVEPIHEMWPQDPEHQQRFKASFNANGETVERIALDLQERFDQANAPLSVIFGHDLESGEGMIDVVPSGVSKAFALNWMIDRGIFARHEVVFAGDSGNDLAAFLSGLHSIVVGNAPEWIHERVHLHAETEGHSEYVYSAREEATIGLVEGLKHFGWLPVD